MHRKKMTARDFITPVKRFFRARSIIIVSDHKVDHLPLSGTMQALLLIGLLGFFSGTSYITGSYVAARASLKDKEAKIATNTIEKTRIGAEMDLLRRDLMKLSQNGKELDSYSKFVLEQSSLTALPDTGSDHFAINASALADGTLFGQSNDRLTDRISYLEQRMNEIRDEDDRLVMAIRERTDKKIDYFEDIIAMTGLDSEHLERLAASGTAKPPKVVSAIAPDSTAEDDDAADEDDTAKDDDAKDGDKTDKTTGAIHGENQGGPFIPYDSSSLSDSNTELLENVDRLIRLHNIVEQLPIHMPIADAQEMSPFGKRVDPINGRFSMHPGVDLAGPADSRILSASAGTVITAGRKIGYGNMVDIDHGFGIVSRYAHMSKILVHEGQQVAKGQQIGVQGSTGRSTGPHLHFEVRINDRPVNPVKFLHAGEYVLEN